MLEVAIMDADESRDGWLEKLAPGTGIGGGGGAIASAARVDDAGTWRLLCGDGGTEFRSGAMILQLPGPSGTG